MLASKFLSEFTTRSQRKGILVEHIPSYYEAVLHIAQTAARCLQGDMVTLGIGGGQGTGKSTISHMVKDVLYHVFSISAEVLSIDDYYLTRNERIELAAKIHPLLAVRGVPGTHDMYWMHSTIASLRGREACKVPVFSKGEDDRLRDDLMKYPPEVLILEGWCWGARPVTDKELQNPVNDLEANQDSELIWRRFVNQALASDIYQKCFSTDLQVFLDAPDMEAIFRWRLQQESQLVAGRRIMKEKELLEFMMHYQRITERMLKQYTADISVILGNDHGVAEIKDRLNHIR